MVDFIVNAGGTLKGCITVPGDKSISHRALMLAALAQGTSTLSHFLAATDTLATLHALRTLGVNITQTQATQLTIQGVGKSGLSAPKQALDLGNAGTGMRLLAGVLAGQVFESTLIGDASLQQRPMDRILTPLAQMGAHITARSQRFAPLHITPVSALHAMRYTLPLASAQVKSCLLLAGLLAQGTTQITETTPTRDHTEKLLGYLDYPCTLHTTPNGQMISVEGQATLHAKPITIPGDFSSAAFFIVGALIAPHADLIIENVGLNPTRTGLLTLLRSMGARIDIIEETETCSEKSGTLRIHSSELKGITVPHELVALAIDEFPIFFIASACAQGETRLTGAAELRVKESDRLNTMSAGLTTLGVKHETYPDGMVIEGCSAFQGGLVDSQQDHRIAMAFSIAALRAKAPIKIKHCDPVATSFPRFVQVAHRAGLDIAKVK